MEIFHDSRSQSDIYGQSCVSNDNTRAISGYLQVTAELEIGSALPRYYKIDPETEKKDGTKMYIPIGDMHDWKKERLCDLGFVFPSDEFLTSVEKDWRAIVNVIIPQGWSTYEDDIYIYVIDQQCLVRFWTCIDLTKFYHPILFSVLEKPWQLRTLKSFLSAYANNCGKGKINE